ncbi:MAG: DUF2336 domain-containing protein [Alphaproteobacteria bacterium]|nr:DUF2336 domain-containing protein [Alphaproteobacteria bacterium]
MANDGFKEDYEALLEMARDKTVAGRAALVNTISDLFNNRNEVLTDQERALMSDILRQLIHAAEMSVRRDLSRKMAAMDNVPHELIVTLANDEIEVAHPILVTSELLHDSDLIEIIHHRTMQHQLSIAMRRTVSESVADALVESGDEDVIKALLENSNAHISKATMEYLVDQSKRVNSYQNPLLTRPDLDPQLARRMYMWVSAALRNYVTEHFEIDPTELDENLDNTVSEITTAPHDPGEGGPDKARELAQRLADAGQVTPEFMIRVLRQGEIPLFEAMFVIHSGLRPKLLQRIMFEPGGEALAVTCKAIDMAKNDFASIFMLTRKARAKETVISPSDLTRVLALYDRVRSDSAKAMLARWQRDPEYLNAIRMLSSQNGKGGNAVLPGNSSTDQT